MNELAQTDTAAPIVSEFADDPDFAELLEVFAETVDEKQDDLRKLFRSGEIDQMRKYAHQLKGAGGGYGFTGLTTLSAELEEACQADDTGRVGEALDQLLDYLDRIAI